MKTNYIEKHYDRFICGSSFGSDHAVFSVFYKKYDLRKLIQRAYDNIPCSPLEKAAVTARIFDVEKEINLTEAGIYRMPDVISVVESAVQNKERLMLVKVPANLEGIVTNLEDNKLEAVSKYSFTKVRSYVELPLGLGLIGYLTYNEADHVVGFMIGLSICVIYIICRFGPRDGP